MWEGEQCGVQRGAGVMCCTGHAIEVLAGGQVEFGLLLSTRIEEFDVTDLAIRRLSQTHHIAVVRGSGSSRSSTTAASASPGGHLAEDAQTKSEVGDRLTPEVASACAYRKGPNSMFGSVLYEKAPRDRSGIDGKFAFQRSRSNRRARVGLVRR
jgi:hypothetical protein